MFCCASNKLLSITANKSILGDNSIGIGSHLFIKVPRPGDNEVTFSVFESSYNCSKSSKMQTKCIVTNQEKC